VFGEGALTALGLAGDPGTARPLNGGIVLTDPRLAELGARAILPRENLRRTLLASGLAEADFAAWDRHRLALGIPDGSRDLVLDKSILLEAGFDELHGVDWQKGCYVGQELTARMKYRALARKRLMPVRIAGPAPEPGAAVMLGDQEAGEIRSVHGDMGLALMRLDQVEEAARDGRALVAGAATILPQKPAWATF
jgi:folate-binding protein YgfZ